jgi:hypothetical protein
VDTVLAVAVLVAVAALAGLSARLLRQNQRLLGDLRDARSGQVLAKLAVEIHRSRVRNEAMVSVVNVGLGPALDCTLQLRFRGVEGEPDDVRQVKASVVVPGERLWFRAPDIQGKIVRPMTDRELGETFESVELIGAARDAYGNPVEIEDAITDLETYVGLSRRAQMLARDPRGEA